MNIFNNLRLDFDLINKCKDKLNIFEEGKSQEAFWDNEHISKQMLEAHINPNWDAASRKAETIEASCKWIISLLNLSKNNKVVDFGCGPGLYCSKLSEYGLHVTGIDYSKRSIEYAKNEAIRNNLSIEYIYKNYLDVDYCDEYDVAMMIYCDFGVLSDESRRIMLRKIHRALKKKGYFIFDIWTTSNKELTSSFSNWSVNVKGGFWSPNSYIELIDKTYYNSQNVSLRQHIIIEDEGKTSVYNLWERCYTLDSIAELLNDFGFEMINVFSDLTGTEYKKGSQTLGVVARRK